MNTREPVRQPDRPSPDEPVRDAVSVTARVVAPRKLALAAGTDSCGDEYSPLIDVPDCADPRLATHNASEELQVDRAAARIIGHRFPIGDYDNLHVLGAADDSLCRISGQ